MPWDTYKLQFEAVTMMNHWREQDKAAHLIISLRGPATGVLSTQKPDTTRQEHRYQQGASLEELPDHLQPLFNRCANGLETTEKEVLHRLLCQFSDPILHCYQ